VTKSTLDLTSEFMTKYCLSTAMIESPNYYRDGPQDMIPMGLSEFEAIFRNPQHTGCGNATPSSLQPNQYMEFQLTMTESMEICTIK
jgi:hypothetical protein